MVTNVPPKCAPFWEKYEEASTVKEKILALEELIACIPKHKGTEKLLKDLKVKLAKLRAELQRSKEATRSKASSLFSIAKKGDAQVVLLGTSYVGKTTLLNLLTGAAYPTGKPTVYPQEGIFKWKGIEFQVVDTPPVLSADLDRTPNGRAIMGLVYNADVVALVLDVTQDLDWQLETLVNAMAEANIFIRPRPPITLKRLPRGGITVIGLDYSPFSLEELKEILKSYRIVNCILEFRAPVTEFDLYLAVNPRAVFKRSVVVLTKMDLIENPKRIYMNVQEKLGEINRQILSIPFAPQCQKCRENLGRSLFDILGLIRIWTKKDGRVNWERALVLKRGATVRDACEKIHSGFLKKFRYAVVERQSEKIKRKIVGLNYVLDDGDILTIYLRD